MTLADTLRANLLSPIPLAFALGVVAKRMKSELSLPRDLYASLSIYLLFALGLKGGVELAHASWAAIAHPAAATLALGLITPTIAFAVLLASKRFGIEDAAGIAAHYGSVSAVTFIAAQQFLQRANVPVEGFMPTLLALMESPGLHLALAIGVVARARRTRRAQLTELASRAAAGVMPRSIAAGAIRADATAADVAGLLAPTPTHAPTQTPPPKAASSGRTNGLADVLHEIVTGRTMVLLVGGLVIGYLMGEPGWKSVSPFFDTGFKGALMLFLLEMGIVAGERLGDLRKVGGFLLAFGILLPIVHGALGVWLGTMAGLSVGGATVLGTMAASASYIAAPPAVRLTLPSANPTYSLTAALAVTFPFNLLVGIPLYFRLAQSLT